MTTVGIIGAGHIGSQIARLAVENGYNVVISNSRGPETLSALIGRARSKSPCGDRPKRQQCLQPLLPRRSGW